MDLFEWKPPERQPSVEQPPEAVPYDIAMLFEHLALEVRNVSGLKRYSARAILHRIRWHHQVERRDADFKCNNNWTPSLARWLIRKYPEFDGFFELRQSPGASDGDDDERA